MNRIGEQADQDRNATAFAQPESVVSVRGLVKRYGGHEAVRGIDLDVRRGEILSLTARPAPWAAGTR